jgi:recombination protein RecA
MAASSMSCLKGVVVACQLKSSAADAGWRLDYLAGRLIEVSGSAGAATLTMVASVILEAQNRGEPTAWISALNSIFFPPDMAATGIDLDALPVIKVERVPEVAVVADALLRSGSFAVVVMDLGPQVSMSLASQTRLAGLARKYRTAVIGITRKERRRQSLGSLVSLRGDCSHKRVAFQQFTCELQVLKDKRGGSGWRHMEMCRGPDGLC